MKCLQCGEEIFSTHRSRKFCSRKCASRYYYVPQKGKAEARACVGCGKIFAPDTKHPHQKFCSDECREHARRLRRTKKIFLDEQEKLTPKKQPGEKTLEDWVREARECNLDYGNYRALIAAGKTYEELKATADTRTAGEHAHKPYRFI